MNTNSNKYPPFDASKIDQKYKCPECKNIMINVHQADDCGCQYCLKCLEKIIQKKKCIKCNSTLASDSKFPDKYFQKKISNLIANCHLKDCSWSGPLSEYTDHYNEHFEPENKKCKYSSCESKEEYKEPINQETGDCTFNLDQQPAESDDEGIETDSHLEAKRRENTIDTSENDLKITFTKNVLPGELQDNVSQLKLIFDDFSSRVKALEEKKIFLLNSSSEMFHDDSTASLNKENKDSGILPDYSSNELLNDIEKLQNTENNLIKYINELTKANDKLKEENIILEDNIKDCNNSVQKFRKALELAKVSLSSLEERLINLEKVSYDGSLLWKITNVTEKMQEAKSGCKTSFYSPPFYTNRNGYKMCARIYLNGDGNDSNTHMSLFFVILKGENDVLLRWPFKQKVTFTIKDQSSSEYKDTCNSYDAFRSDLNSFELQRPVEEIETSSDIPVSFSLGKLFSTEYHQYIKDNTMFIKIAVDVKDLEN